MPADDEPIIHLRYHYARLSWYAAGSGTFVVFGLVAAGFAAAGIGSLRRRGVSGSMIAIVLVMATIAAIAIATACWYWRTARDLDHRRGEFGIVIEDGRLLSTDWDPVRIRRVDVRLADIESAVEASYKGASFVQLRTVQQGRFALPMRRLDLGDRDLLRQALGIERR